MRKIPGVKTVRVSLNDGLTVLDLDARQYGHPRATADRLEEQRLRVQGGATGGSRGRRGDGTRTCVHRRRHGRTLHDCGGRFEPAVYEILKQRAQAGQMALTQLKGLTGPPGKAPPTLTIEAFQ